MTVVVGRDDHRAFAGISPLAPLARLAQYSVADEPSAQDAKGSFAPVSAGELAKVRRVYVFVHGWLPGSKETTDTIVAESGSAKAWDERVSNTTGTSMTESYSPLLDALKKREPDSAVLWFSWVDQSSTDAELFAARDSFRNTEVNGRRLAIALQQAWGRGKPELHIIGHSHGSVVSTHAALALTTAPAQLTLLDCPEDFMSRAGGAAGLLDIVLPRLSPTRSEQGTFVDSYASMFGHNYHSVPGLSAVVDVRLAPKVSPSSPATPASQAHQYAISWYTQTIRNAAPHGFGWSPLNGYDVRSLKQAYVQGTGDSVIAVGKSDTDGSPPTDHMASVVDVESQELSRQNPDLAFRIPISPAAAMVEFDYQVQRPGKNTVLEGAVDGQLKFLARPLYPVQARGRYLRLDSAAQSSALVQFRLVNPGRFTTVTISRLQIDSRQSSVVRNYDDTKASTAIALAGGLVGAGITLAGVGIAVAINRRWRGRK